MDVNIIDNSNWEKTVEVVMPVEELKPDFDRVYREYKKNVRLEGFRKGKVPVSLIKQLFGKEIEARVAEEKVPDILEDISKEKNFNPISPAKIEEISYDDKEGLKFKAQLEIVPEIELDKYTGFTLEKRVYRVNDNDLQQELQNLRERYAIMNNIDDEAQYGHYIIADFQLLDETGVPVIGQKLENQVFILSKGEELSEQLVGIKINEKRQVSFKDENDNKQKRYEVTVKEIKEKKLPELDDEFAKDVGQDTLEQLKEKLLADLKKKYSNEDEFLLEETIIDELVKANTFEIPEPMINNYLEIMLEDFKKNYGEIDDKEEFKERYRVNAIRTLKWIMIKDKILEKEKIEVSDAEIDEHIEKLAQVDEKRKLSIKNYYRNEKNREKLKNELLNKKIFNFIKEHSEIKEKTVTNDDLNKETNIIA